MDTDLWIPGKGHGASTKLPLGTQSLARNGEIIEGSQARGKKVVQKSVVLCTVRCVGTRCDVVIIGWKRKRERNGFLSFSAC